MKGFIITAPHEQLRFAHVQALINLGVNLGLLPTKGLTLPFMSFGGNSLLVSLVMLGLLLRLDWECRLAPAVPKKTKVARNAK